MVRISAYRHIVVYGISLALLLFLLKWLEFRLLIIHYAIDVYMGALAVIFTALGAWLTLKVIKPGTVVVEKEVPVPVYQAAPFNFNEKAQEQHNISPRELDVLQLMAEGLSNKEIAARLFVSENTVKTHSSNLFVKMDVSRRTQAVDRGRKMGLVP